jgi:hypothetical protein
MRVGSSGYWQSWVSISSEKRKVQEASECAETITSKQAMLSSPKRPSAGNP